MQPDEFRRHAHELVDWMADYLRDVGERRIVPGVAPGEIRRSLPAAPPQAGEPFERIAADFSERIMPGMTHWNHPGWFGYFPANHSPPSILAEMLIATLGAQCMSWQTSPAATELEQVVMDWLRQMLGLPDGFTGVIQDTSSTATLVALLTARESALERGGSDLSRLAVYTSAEAHSSVAKGARLAGYGADRLRLIEVDAAYAMDPARLEAAIANDEAAGLVPAAVVATIGTTSSTAVDPLRAIGEISRRHGAWLHVDASYAGAAAILPERRDCFDGMELADSLVVNPHKWLLTNFPCSAYYVQDVPSLLRTFSTAPAYLQTAHDPAVVNYRDWGIQLGRQFRALKLWFVIRSYGVEGLQAMLRHHMTLAALFRSWVLAEPEFAVAAPSPFGLVCFRHEPAALAHDAAALGRWNQELLQRVNAPGDVYLTHTMLGGRYTLRMAIGQWQTEEAHVRRAWEVIREAAGRR
jgi:aromatic-L-amino-acid/L-tryptophan decarboxylase